MILWFWVWICKIERWCCEAWIKSNLSLFNWCDCRIRSGRNMLWRQSNSLVDVLFCLVVMDLLIRGRRGAEGAWWKARLRVWWVERQFLLYTFAMKERKPSGRLKTGSSKQFFKWVFRHQKTCTKCTKCTYESRSNWQFGTIGIPRSIEFILCYQVFDCPRLCFFRSWQVRSFPSTRLTSGHSIVDNPTLFPTWSHESFKWHHANCICWN